MKKIQKFMKNMKFGIFSRTYQYSSGTATWTQV